MLNRERTRQTRYRAGSGEISNEHYSYEKINPVIDRRRRGPFTSVSESRSASGLLPSPVLASSPLAPRLLVCRFLAPWLLGLLRRAHSHHRRLAQYANDHGNF